MEKNGVFASVKIFFLPEIKKKMMEAEKKALWDNHSSVNQERERERTTHPRKKIHDG